MPGVAVDFSFPYWLDSKMGDPFFPLSFCHVRSETVRHPCAKEAPRLLSCFEFVRLLRVVRELRLFLAFFLGQSSWCWSKKEGFGLSEGSTWIPEDGGKTILLQGTTDEDGWPWVGS